MYDLDRAYSKRFFAQRRSLSWRVGVFCDTVIRVLSPRSVIDYGCGNGDLVRGFRDRGIHALGIEGTENSRHGGVIRDILIQDLRLPISMGLSCDLSICLEVAEHVEPQYTGTLVKTITTGANRLLFSAARPDQGGIHHHNCKPQSYWMAALATHGLFVNSIKTDMLREGIKQYKDKKGIKAYYKNMLYFERSQD